MRQEDLSKIQPKHQMSALSKLFRHQTFSSHQFVKKYHLKQCMILPPQSLLPTRKICTEQFKVSSLSTLFDCPFDFVNTTVSNDNN